MPSHSSVFKIMSVYIIEYSHGTHGRNYTCQPEHKVHFHLCLKAVIIALIVTVGTIVIPAPQYRLGKNRNTDCSSNDIYHEETNAFHVLPNR